MTKLQVLFVSLAGVRATIQEEQNQANPIRRVVSMLQMMQNKVSAEGEKKKAIYDKFMCYCENADDLLAGAIKASEAKIPMLESAIGSDAAAKKQLDLDLVAHKQAQVDAKAAIVKSTEIRAKEAATYAKESATLKTNIGELDKALVAVSALAAGKGGSGFLQTNMGSTLRDLSVSLDMSEVDRQLLSSFLASGSSPAMAQISGILEGMRDDMKKDLVEATDNENAAIAAQEELVAIKKKEVQAVQVSIESKMVRSAEIAVAHAQQLNDLDDTQEDLAESKKFFADLDINCASKKKEWVTYQKMQGEEQLALADTIKILNDDDALEMFKKTLPASAANLLQIKVSTTLVKEKAVKALKARSAVDPRMDFIEVALHGSQKGFDKIVKMIDELVAQLKKDQAADDAKKSYCEAELDKTEDKTKVLAQESADSETMLDDATESVANLKVEIEALDDGIRALDKDVASATESRKEEHEDFTAGAAGNAAAVDLLKFAKNRLNKFYNPSQYKAPPKRQLSENEQIIENMGYTQISAHGGVAPPAAPEANLAYTTKSEESTGVIRMLDNLINDVETGMQEADLEEKDAQKDYEKFMSNAASKRASDSKSMTDKQSALADTQAALVDGKGKLSDTNIHRMDTEKYLGDVHAECDWLLGNFNVRKEARVDEGEALRNAKAVLSGADYSL